MNCEQLGRKRQIGRRAQKGKSFIILAAALLVAASLSACESFPGQSWQSWESAFEREQKVSLRTAGAPGGALGVGGVQTASRQFPVPGDRDLMVLTDKMAGHAVDIYDISAVQDLRQPEGRGRGIPAATDPRVTVYPIDMQTGYPGQSALVPFAEDLSAQNQQQQQQQPQSQSHAGAQPGPQFQPRPSWPQTTAWQAPLTETLTDGYTSREGSLFFGHGSDRLDPKSRQIVADIARRSPANSLTIEGHASLRTEVKDPVQARILNLKESMDRAFSVSSQLIRAGVPPENVKTVAWGDSRALEGAESKSRRVDIYAGWR